VVVQPNKMVFWVFKTDFLWHLWVGTGDNDH
jgi:hypothetical protein